MSQEQQPKAAESQFNEQLQVKSIEKPAELLESSLQNLENFGGFDLFENLIDEVQNL